jgi:hypothetical protein
VWYWVGDPQEVTAEKLERAEQLFFFALCRHQIINTDLGEELHFDLLKGKGGVRNFISHFLQSPLFQLWSKMFIPLPSTIRELFV